MSTHPYPPYENALGTYVHIKRLAGGWRSGCAREELARACGGDITRTRDSNDESFTYRCSCSHNTQHRTSRSCAEHNSHGGNTDTQSVGLKVATSSCAHYPCKEDHKYILCSPDFPCASCQTLVPKLMLNGICCNAAKRFAGYSPVGLSFSVGLVR